jgi:pimeloyl-ACP methyl ester carboxylesterase
MAQTRRIPTDRLEQQVLEAGTGPLVLLIHGFPELAISWRAQVAALADAGFHAVAPDMRGYGGTGGPARTEDFTILHLVGDMVDLVRALGHDSCVVVGHDWGAPVAWHCALIRPDLFTAVAGLSMPFQPRTRGGPPIAAWAHVGPGDGLGPRVAILRCTGALRRRDHRLRIDRRREPVHEPRPEEEEGAPRRVAFVGRSDVEARRLTTARVSAEWVR